MSDCIQRNTKSMSPTDPFSTSEKTPLVYRHINGDKHDYPDQYRNQISIDVIHDGDNIPARFLHNGIKAIDTDRLMLAYRTERDWGANIVAEQIAKKLGLDGYTSVNTARCLLDFGRFPGSTQEGATHLGRFAINLPFSTFLNNMQKRDVLEDHYDFISNKMDEILKGKLIKIAIHTYDRTNKSGTVRPNVSLVTRTLGYQQESKMPFGVFDPLYPDILAEFTVDRVLRDRISLTLEKNRIPVAHNYPYLLPEGSAEVRHQVWRFFHWLQARFEAHFPETETDTAHQKVWLMLKDTNLRSSEAGQIRSILHMFRRPPPNKSSEFESITSAYERIKHFTHRDNDKIIQEYRQSPFRCMSLGIEVRKDLLFKLDKDGLPIEAAPEQGLEIANNIADAISTYLREDRMHSNPFA